MRIDIGDDGARSYGRAVFQHDPGGVVTLDENFAHLGADIDADALFAGGSCHGLRDRAHAANGVSPHARLAVHLAEHVVQQHIGGAGAVRAREIADHGIEAEHRLDRIGLEPRVEHVARGSAQEPKCRRKTVILPKPLADRRELTQPTQSLGDVAQNQIWWRSKCNAAENFSQAANLRLIGRIAGRILGAEFRDFTIGAALAGEQITPIRKRQKILRAAFDEAQSVLAQFQIVDDLGL